MSVQRLALRLGSLAPRSSRLLSTSTRRCFADPKDREHETQPAWREIQKSKATNPHMTNTTSTISNEMPSVGADHAPPELLSSVDPDFMPKDADPENTEKMTGGTQKGGPEGGANADLEVGEMEGAKFKVEPLRRTGEDANTMRARLLCLLLHMIARLFSTLLITSGTLQIRAGRGEHSKVTFYSLPSPMSIFPK